MVLPYRESVKLALLGQMRGTSAALAWAIACGRGAITSNARAFAEETSHGNGMSYRQGQVGELASAIEAVLKEPERVREWAKAATVLNEQRLWSRTGHSFVGYFDALLQAAPLGGRSRQPAAVGSPLSGGRL
jgi:glycosyltransferase involved in cell wall biosynthesis